MQSLSGGQLLEMLPQVLALSSFLLLMLPVIGQSDANATLSCSNQCTCNVKSHMPESFIVNCTEITSVPKDLPLKANELLFSYSPLHKFNLADLSHLTLSKRLVLDHCNLSEFLSNQDLVKKLPDLEVLDLSYNNLKTIPAGLPASLRTLLLSHNSIVVIDYQSTLSHMHNLEELFLDYNLLTDIKVTTFHDDQSLTSLSSLKKLVLSSNRLNLIEDDVFKGFDSLSALTLADNQLSSLHKGMLSGLDSLRYLDVNCNKLSTIDDETFHSLRQLKYVNMSHNRLTTFPHSLPMLEWLDMSHNLIQVISEDLKSSIYPIEVLNLAHNPLHCDCHMRWFKELYDRREYLVKHIEISAKDFIPTCATPESLAEESWDLLGDEVFTCSPVDTEVSEEAGATGVTTRVGIVSDTTIQVIWTSSMPGFASWNILIQYYVFGHRTATMKRIEVSAAQPDYVLRHLRPSTNYVICVQAKKMTSDHQQLSPAPPVSLSDCMEVSTKEPKPPQLTSRLEVLFYYILGMLATFIGIFAAIGGFAMLYGIWNSSTQWSARYVGVDNYLDGTSYPTDEPIIKDKKPHKD